MRGHRRSALALVMALGLAGCGTGPRGYYASDPPRIPLGGSFTLEPGQEVVVYGVRSRLCGMPPPTFETAAGEMFGGAGAQAPVAGEVYDAGTGQSLAVLCGGNVPVRAIGYRAPADFEGEVSMVFYGTDQATVTVARPPEPGPEEEGEPEVAPEAVQEEAPVPEAAPVTSPAPLPEDEVLPRDAADEIRREEGPVYEQGPVHREEMGPVDSPFIRGREFF